MRPTRRGLAVACVVVGAVAMAIAFGARSLNALVVPALVALAAAFLQIQTLDRPTLRRRLPRDDFVGVERTATLDFETDNPVFATVTETVTIGRDRREHVVETTVGGDGVEVPVSYDARGEGTLGPTEVAAQDVLGLLETTFTYSGREHFLAYPPVRPLADTAWHELSAMRDTSETPDRDEFDNLREYARGDALRDIHWKSSAKRDDLIVKQFVADESDEAVVIAAGGDSADADLLAEATASLAVALSESGVSVHLALPDTTVEAGLGNDHRVRMLEALALTDGGERPDVETDLSVDVADGVATIRIGTTETTFDRLTGAATDDVVRGIAAVATDPTEARQADTLGDGAATAADGGVME